MECYICLNNWSYDLHVPRILQCGHSLCTNCAVEYWLEEDLICPICKTTHGFSALTEAEKTRLVETLPKNFTLLALVDERSSLSRQRSYEKTCELHKKPAYWYTVKPYSLVCELCAQEYSDMQLEIKPIAEVLETTRKNLDSSLNVLSELITSASIKKETLVNECTSDSEIVQIDHHFNELFKIHERCHSNALQGVQISTADKVDEVRIVLDNAQHEKERLERELVELEHMTQMDDKELIRFHSNVMDMAEHQTSANSTIESFVVKVKIDPNALNTHLDLLKQSFYRANPTGDYGWQCEECGAAVTKGAVQCENCGRFKPLHLYPNLVQNPLQATQEEIQELMTRRNLEFQLVSEVNSQSISSSDWFIINADWINDWKNFIFNKANKNSPLVSTNKKIGVLPPGPVSNNLLYEDRECKILKQRLKPVANYRGVNEKIWKLYVKFYGGGPQIIRKKLNIYE